MRNLYDWAILSHMFDGLRRGGGGGGVRMEKISESSRKGYSCLMDEKKVTSKTVSVTM